jgi:uncharacterized protein YndB with AHSA1/START domain
MLTENAFGEELSRQAVFMARFLRAPRDLVFDALVEPEHLARWCGPSDFKPSVCEVELWQDGTHRSVLRGPYGKELILSGVYREVRRPARLVYTERFEVEPHSSHEHIIDITLTARSGGTALILTERPQAEAKEVGATMQIGAWEANLQSLDRLAELVESMSTGSAQDDPDRAWAFMPFERDGRVQAHRPSGTYERPRLAIREGANEEAKAANRSEGRRRALGRFAALFVAR